MGHALAKTLLEAGHQVTVWNRSPGKDDDLVELGATRAATVAQAVQGSELVIVCVLDYPAVRQVLDVDLRGKTVVNLTNGRPSEARELAAWVAESGAAYLDGGIMAVPPMIGNPGALILYSGEEAALEEHRDVLETLAEARFLGNDPGLAALHDLALLSGMYGMFAGFFQAAGMVGTEKIPATAFTEDLLVPWVTAMLGLLPTLARSIDAQDQTTTDANAEVNRAALANILLTSKEQGINGDLLAPLHSTFDRLVADGRHDADLSAAIGAVRQ